METVNDLEVCVYNRLPHVCGTEGLRQDLQTRKRLVLSKRLKAATPKEVTPFFNVEGVSVLKLDRVGVRSALSDLQKESWPRPSDAKSRQSKNGAAA